MTSRRKRIATIRTAAWTAIAALLIAPAASAAPDPATPQQRALKAHVAFLASDAMQGREAGTPAYDIAAEYVASRMAAAGLKPGGEQGGWFQPVTLVSSRTLDTSMLRLTVGGRRRSLVLGTDWVMRNEGRASRLQVDAPVVFAGYGIVDAASGRDDYAGLDVRGRIVAVLTGAPDGFASDLSAYLGSRQAKIAAAARAGAAGVIVLQTPANEKVTPFRAIVQYGQSTLLNWATPDGRPNVPARDTPMLGMLSLSAAASLFAGSPIDWNAVQAAAVANRPIPTGALNRTLAADIRSEIGRTVSRNIVGRIDGGDPALAAEHVVLTAHLDHVGVGPADAKGDRIYNGALDNAIGIGAMLEAARTFAAGPVPKRSLLFVAVTAEEKGLIGSDYFAQHPTVPVESIVADVNLDMPILTYRFVDMVALGADRSSLGPIVAAAAGAYGVKLVPDPNPEEGNFTRSDHYSFVKQGIPAVSLDLGPGGPGAKATRDFLDKQYHEPSDDLSLPIDWVAAETFVAINVGIVRRIADAPTRPTWNQGDFFGTLFGRAAR